MTRDLSFSRSARYGTRQISSLWQKWNQLREAIRSLDPIQIQAAFDDCEPWIDWTFWRSSEQSLPSSDELLSVATDEEAVLIRACINRLKSR